MNQEEYIQTRVDDQIEWYNTKSAINKKYHLISKTIIIIFATLLPFISGFINTERIWLIYPLSALAVLTAVLTGLTTVFKFQEKWNEYRTICETLKHEKYIFLTKTKPYDTETEGAFNSFVKRIESLISEENSKWLRYIDKDEGFQ